MNLKSLWIFALTCIWFSWAGPVSYYGELQASENKLVGSKTGSTPVQVRGISLGWSNTGWESADFFNSTTVSAMVDSWKAEIIRVPMGYEENGGYKSDAASNLARVKAAVDAAIAKDVYVIIDWHSHKAHLEQSAAIAFFTQMAQTYGSNDHVIFEIYNEPYDYYGWSDNIRPYAEAVIAAIRSYSDNLILVGTRAWSQQVNEVASSPLTDGNVAYVLHFYAASHPLAGNTTGGVSFQTAVTTALGANLPVFVSEWGTTSADGGTGGNYYTHSASNSDAWHTFLDQKKISSCAWNVNDKYEGSAFFGTGTDFNQNAAANWTNTGMMTTSGQYVYNLLNSYAATAAWRNASSSSSVSSSSSAGSSSSSAGAGFTLIDDFEDGDNVSNTQEFWYIYTDAGDGGASTVANTKDGSDYVVVMDDGTGNHVAMLQNFALSKGTNKNDPYVAIGLEAINNQSTYFLNQCTDGFSYRYKGSAHRFRAEISTVTDYDVHYASLPTVTAWTTATVAFADLKQAGWGAARTFNAALIEKFAWEVKETPISGSLMIDDFKCLGADLDLPSSSSAAGGSSNSGVSSSSSAESSSSSVPAESGFYWITRFNDGEQTTYGDYPFAFVYGNPNKVTIANAKDDDGFIVAVDGEGVLKNAVLVNETSYGAGAIGVKNSTSGSLSIADCEDGFSYKYKGAAHQFKLEINANTCKGQGGSKTDGSNSFYQNQSASDSYITVTVTPAEFTSSAWNNSWCFGETLDLADVTQMAWELKYGVSGNAGDAVSLTIDDVKCLGSGLSTDNVSSSSSAGSSSSSSMGSGGFSSSSADDPVSSSSSEMSQWIAQNPGIPTWDLQSSRSSVILNVMQIGNADVEIFDLRGKPVRKLQHFGSGSHRISLENLPQGIYWVRAKLGSKQQTVKVIVY